MGGAALGKCRTTFPARARGGMNTRSREAGRGSTVRSASTLLEKVEYVEQKEDFYATVNEEQMLKNSTFPIKAEELLGLPRSSWQQTTVAISRSFWLTISLSRDLLLAQLERSHSSKLFLVFRLPRRSLT